MRGDVCRGCGWVDDGAHAVQLGLCTGPSSCATKQHNWLIEHHHDAVYGPGATLTPRDPGLLDAWLATLDHQGIRAEKERVDARVALVRAMLERTER